MKKSFYEVEIEMSLTYIELRNMVIKMLRDKKILLALTFVASFVLNNHRLPLCECFNDKEIEKFVDSMKGKSDKIKSITFCKLTNPCSKITYDLH